MQLFTMALISCQDKEMGSDSGFVNEETAEIQLLLDLSEQLSGEFDSTAQSLAFPEYYAVQLIACSVEAPEIGDVVLYIEQALVETSNAPYRQRLYHLEALGDTTAQSSIYELDNPALAIGLCSESSERLFTIEDAQLKSGCEVVLEWDGEGFIGSTVDQNCQSEMNGSSYATSEVYTRSDRIESWDRGWTSNGQQAWGAVSGAYIFLRRESRSE